MTASVEKTSLCRDNTRSRESSVDHEDQVFRHSDPFDQLFIRPLLLSRVTGGNPSSIFGTIQTTGFGSANLFLLNPAGVLFGPTATLNLGGSFHVSTADYLRLTDGVRFNAIPGPQDALLSTAPVAAFGF